MLLFDLNSFVCLCEFGLFYHHSFGGRRGKRKNQYYSIKKAELVIEMKNEMCCLPFAYAISITYSMR